MTARDEFPSKKKKNRKHKMKKIIRVNTRQLKIHNGHTFGRKAFENVFWEEFTIHFWENNTQNYFHIIIDYLDSQKKLSYQKFSKLEHHNRLFLP